MNFWTEPLSRRAVIRSMIGSSILLPGILSDLLAGEVGPVGSFDPLAPKAPHFAAKAKRMIFLYSTGGVSHIDTFDPKSTEKGRDGTGKDKLMGCQWGYSANPR